MDKPPAPRPPIPSRHGADVETARRIAASLRRTLPGDPEPTPERWQAIGESLLHGDEPMDRLVAWMVAEGMGRTRPLFDAAVRHGIARVPDAPEPLRTFFTAVEAMPTWVDANRLQEGARVTGISGLVGMNVLRDLSLLGGYQASAINRTLVLTGALETGPARRLAETTKWWIDCTRPGGMARGAPGYQSTLQVRWIHAMVRRHVAALPVWDAGRDGVPVNQGDMHATYLAFSVMYLIGQRALGVVITPGEGAAVMHLWRYIGWLMGVEPRWLHDTELEAQIALYHNLLSQAPPDETSRQLGRALKDEPLARRYANAAWLRGHWNRAKHLSIARAFLGARGMRALGLSPWTLPWYPVLTIGPRLVWHHAIRALPRGRAYLSRRGLAAQQAYLKTLFGVERAPDLMSPSSDGPRDRSASETRPVMDT